MSRLTEYDRLVESVLYAHDWQARSLDGPRADGSRRTQATKVTGPALREVSPGAVARGSRSMQRQRVSDGGCDDDVCSLRYRMKRGLPKIGSNRGSMPHWRSF